MESIKIIGAFGTISDVSPPSSASNPVQRQPSLAVLSIAGAVDRTTGLNLCHDGPNMHNDADFFFKVLSHGATVVLIRYCTWSGHSQLEARTVDR